MDDDELVGGLFLLTQFHQCLGMVDVFLGMVDDYEDYFWLEVFHFHKDLPL